MKRVVIPAFALLMILMTSEMVHAQGGCCIRPDNGGGTVSMPSLCNYYGPLLIDDGIPGGSILIDAQIIDWINDNEVPGGNLGGTIATFDAQLRMHMTGIGSLAGFVRTVWVPLFSSEFHFGPRTPGDALQVFFGDVVDLSGTIFGDPDFDLILFQAGTNFGFPSPGETKLDRIGPPGTQFQVDSFFDVEYSIRFVGAPGSVLDGLSGTTQSTGLFEHCPGTATNVPGPEPVPSESSSWGAVKQLFVD